ncbi:adenosylmethionine--8-amino-7-oxononanoate transaminase [Lacipirellula limnantheis]|uniref:Adenosylmethionine-8-amino-7-oxononanoate aminotransferase n=1 Tax=Lacipirellula limnantheis TaxID=2528024 RepID=A0A517U023_9BACT|nr:adenosylmethionine--8-amino-7-oxononanoate transaminase [Lacipirellula limnantheis]QDT73976.1 L-Lysine-8-amino-7-oxononanoate aminotransferase [Lacipirellula limnantheis]
MPTPAELTDWDLRHFWHSFTQMSEYEPMVIERAEGSWLVDVHGRRYLDGVSSLWCNLLGHRHPRIEAAIVEQLGKLPHATTLGMSNVPAVELSRRLAELAPGELNRVFYASDGSCAVEAALKIAFQYWLQCPTPRQGKTKYLAYDSAYHGDTLGSTAVGGIERFHALYKPLLFDVLRLPPPDARLGDASHHLALLERALHRHHEEVAALVIEPLLQGAAGMVLQPPGYLRGVRELTRRYDVLLIADEIVTGFCRTGRMFACEHEGVTPDLLCLGKSITSGTLPLAATIASDEIYAAFLGDYASGCTFHHGHTYAGNPLAAAAACATLDVIADERVLEETVPRLAEKMARVLAPLRDHAHVADVRQMGTIAGVELCSDRDGGIAYPANQRHGYRVAKQATSQGVWLRPLGDVVVVMPPLSINDAELELLGHVLRESIDAICQ